MLDERDAQKSAVEVGWRKPLPDRVADGYAIENLRFIGHTQEGHLEFSCPHNRSRFREGDILLLDRGNPFDPSNIQANLEVDDGDHLAVSIAQGAGVNLEPVYREPDGWIADQGYLDLSSFIVDALREVGSTTVGTQRILPLLMGVRRPCINTAICDEGLDIAQSLGLNADQQEGFAQSYATDLAWLVQGPPGTGKTRVLAHLAAQLASDGERVLVTAFTHRAINNALNKLTEVSPTTDLAKIGALRRADDLINVSAYGEFSGCPLESSDQGYVIGVTPFAPRTGRLEGVSFDTVIFDEASQITLPLAIMGMLPGKRFIFFGDHRQLPPVLVGRHRDGSLSGSIFEILAGHGFDTMLTQTYRLNDVLTEWPSRSFYDSRLGPISKKVAERRICYPTPPARFTDILDSALPKVFVDLEHWRVTTRHRAEAQVVADLIVTLRECGIAPDQIGVVTPYRAQGREIRSIVRTLLPKQEARGIIVDTVERMQGQERDIVIVSLTTSNTAFAKQVAEFFFQPQRINVAVTRPSCKLIIVGSRHVLDTQPDEPEQQQAVDLLRDLVNSCTYFTLATDGAGRIYGETAPR